MRHGSYRFFVFILIFTPLAFGTVEPWSLAVMECLAFAGLCALLIRGEGAKGLRLHEVPGLIPLACMGLWFLIQLLPLPAGLVRKISPETYRAYAETIGLFRPVEWASLSLAKKETLAEFFRFSAAVVFYILTVQLLAGGARLRRTVMTVMAFASVLAAMSILQYLLYNQRIFWFRELTQGGAPFGPFVNRNHYAGFMEMVFPVALSVFLASRPLLLQGTLRERMVEFFNQRRTNVHILSGLACIIIAVSIFLSLSRGGIISLCISLVLFGLMLLRPGTNKRRGIILVGVCLLIILSVGWFGWQPILDRFDNIRDPRGNITDARKVIWADSIRMARDFPLIGSGFGSYPALYPRYRTLEGTEIVEHAHNDYLELLAEGGGIAFVLMAWFLWSVAARSYQAFRKRRDVNAIYLFIGSVSGMAAILIHSMTDFNLHIGSNGLYFFFLAGLAVSASHTRFIEGKNSTLLKTVADSSLRLALPAASVLLFAALVFHAGALLAGYYYSTIRDVRLHRLKEKGEFLMVGVIARRAAFFSPLDARYRYAVGDTSFAMADAVPALRAYQQAVCLSPLKGEYLQRLGMVYAGMKDTSRAGSLIRAGIAVEPKNPAVHTQYGLWLFDRGEREKGLAALRSAISLAPRSTREHIAALVLRGLKDEEIREALPQRVEPHLIFADYLHMTDREEQARREFLDSFLFLENEKSLSPGPFHSAYNYLMGKGHYDDAVSVMQKAVGALPEDIGLRLAAGAAYEKAGMVRRAAEEYRRALMINPKNETARRKLAELG